VPNQLSDEEKRERLREIMADFDVAMLSTHALDGTMRSRPLAIADNRSDGELYFSTAAESPKVNEILADPRVNVTMQDGRRFISVTGTARVVEDRALVDKLWSESWKIWFPKGKDDPSLRIVIVDPSEAAYWDGKGVQGLKYVFQMAKAYVQGTRPSSDSDEAHVARVKL
jgi:general stress protein 26